MKSFHHFRDRFTNRYFLRANFNIHFYFRIKAKRVAKPNEIFGTNVQRTDFVFFFFFFIQIANLQFSDFIIIDEVAR